MLYFLKWFTALSVLPLVIKFTDGLTVLILARGGSRGIPLKNLATVGGHSLLKRAIKTARMANFSSVLVSTDHVLIALEALRCDAEIFPRSSLTASDTAPSIWGVQEVLEHYPDMNVIALLQATSPFINPEHLTKAAALMSNEDIDCVFSVKRSHRLLWKQIGKYVKPVNFRVESRPRRQDWAGELQETGSFYFAKRNLLEKGLFQNERCAFVEISDPFTIDIDTEIDLRIANAVWSTLQ